MTTNDRYTTIALFGPPGIGKGTQLELLTQNYPAKFFPISTGEIFREIKKGQSPLPGDRLRQIDDYLQRQVLIPDIVTNGIVEDYITYGKEKNLLLPSSIVVLDGYPRTVAQADYALGRFAHRAVINLTPGAGENVWDALVERIANRALSQQTDKEKFRAGDLNQTEVRGRMYEFQQKTAPVIGRYRDAGIPVYEVASLEPSKQEVHEQVVTSLEEALDLSLRDYAMK